MTVTDTDTDPLRRLFGVAIDPQTYRNAAYLLLTFPLGILYFTLIVSWGAAGVGTLPVIVGIPVLATLVVAVVHLAALEGRLANGLLGTDVAYRAAQPDAETLVPYLKRVTLDPRTYLAGAYLLSKFAIGIAAFVVLVTLASLSAAFTAAPLLYDLPEVSYRIGVWHPATLSEALVVSLLGIALAVATLHLVNLAAWLVGEYTEVMLGSDGDVPAVGSVGRDGGAGGLDGNPADHDAAGDEPDAEAIPSDGPADWRN